MKKPTAMILVLLSVAAAWAAVTDSPENRRTEARRYLESTPPQALFEDMAEQMAKTMAEESREEFKALLTKHLDIKAVTEAMEDAMTSHFTAEELRAMAEFYGSPAGKSVMKKFGSYMAEVMPRIQTEIGKAQAKALEEQQKKDDKELR